MRRLDVLYDDRCGVCSRARRWLQRQPAYLELSFWPMSSERTRQLFPELVKEGVPEELIAVSDEGDIYRGGDAWIMCLYALTEYREWSHRLAHPALRPWARHAFVLVSRQRFRLSRWLRLSSDAEIAGALQQVVAPSCTPGMNDPRPEPGDAPDGNASKPEVQS